MYTVKVEGACGCFLKSRLCESKEFTNEEAARQEAESMLKIMQDNFCKKHEFGIREEVESFIISIRPRKQV
ncbi:hypothetical protein KJ877_02460 [bacterium]|nr:hypothetical protein [bacterium]MBU1990648.1 hypothetical protein [bacterium]